MPSSHHIAVTQPYFFPYLGYYQLVHHVDTFVFLDDVNFIKKGFIHRNSIRLNKRPHQFTLSVSHQSQNRHINEHLFMEDVNSIINIIGSAYSKAPNFSRVMPLVNEILGQTDRNVAKLAARSISSVFDYLAIPRNFLFSSEISKNNALKAQDRIIEVCRVLGAQRYTNPIGGMELYSREAFRAVGIHLEFIRMGNVTYEAPNYPFIPGLSIIDALMICSTDEVRALFENYDVA